MRGSPLYMAPEIICKGTYDSRVDLWSIGVIIYGLYWYLNKILANIKRCYDTLYVGLLHHYHSNKSVLYLECCKSSVFCSLLEIKSLLQYQRKCLLKLYSNFRKFRTVHGYSTILHAYRDTIRISIYFSLSKMII